MSRRLLIANLILALWAGQALAQDVRLYRSGETVDPTDVARILDASTAREPVIKMRSLRLLGDAPAAKATQAEPTGGGADALVATQIAYASATPAEPAALALPVQFGFDSADILPSARRQLDALAEGIRLLPLLRSVVIEGHTDASGSVPYNESLSQRRANAVKHYLVATHGIDPGRLHAVGLGEYGLLRGYDPYAPENRRVQLRGE